MPPEPYNRPLSPRGIRSMQYGLMVCCWPCWTVDHAKWDYLDPVSFMLKGLFGVCVHQLTYRYMKRFCSYRHQQYAQQPGAIGFA